MVLEDISVGLELKRREEMGKDVKFKTGDYIMDDTDFRVGKITKMNKDETAYVLWDDGSCGLMGLSIVPYTKLTKKKMAKVIKELNQIIDDYTDKENGNNI